LVVCFIIHLAAILNPIPKVEVIVIKVFSALDLKQYAKHTDTSAIKLWIIKSVYSREVIAEFVGDRDCNNIVVGVAKLIEAGCSMGISKKAGELLFRRWVHVPIPVAVVDVSLVKRVVTLNA